MKVKKASGDEESSDESESSDSSDAEMLLTQASIAAEGEKSSSKTVAEKNRSIKRNSMGK